MSFEQCFGDLLAMEGTYANGTMPNRQHTPATPSSKAAFTPNFQNKVPFWITRVEPSHLFPLSKMYQQANLFYAIVYFAHPCSEVRRGPESYAPARDLTVLQLRCQPVFAGGGRSAAESRDLNVPSTLAAVISSLLVSLGGVSVRGRIP